MTVLRHEKRKVLYLELFDRLTTEVVVSDDAAPLHTACGERTGAADGAQVHAAIAYDGVAGGGVALPLTDGGAHAEVIQSGSVRIHAAGGGRPAGADRHPVGCRCRAAVIDDRVCQREGCRFAGVDRRHQPLVRGVAGGVYRAGQQHLIAGVQGRDHLPKPVNGGMYQLRNNHSSMRASRPRRAGGLLTMVVGG